MLRFLLPLGIFALLVVFFFIGLGKDPSKLPSPLLDKPAPAFEVQQLQNPQINFTPEQMKGQVWVLNVWASWCASCRSEHPLFMEIARKGDVPLVGLNYKDERADGLRWLQQLGNPYKSNAWDYSGDVGIDFGVYGVPESFLIDKEGVIRYKHVGPISRQDWNEIFLPKIKELRG